MVFILNGPNNHYVGPMVEFHASRSPNALIVTYSNLDLLMLWFIWGFLVLFFGLFVVGLFVWMCWAFCLIQLVLICIDWSSEQSITSCRPLGLWLSFYITLTSTSSSVYNGLSDDHPMFDHPRRNLHRILSISLQIGMILLQQIQTVTYHIGDSNSL